MVKEYKILTGGHERVQKCIITENRTTGDAVNLKAWNVDINIRLVFVIIFVNGWNISDCVLQPLSSSSIIESCPLSDDAIKCPAHISKGPTKNHYAKLKKLKLLKNSFVTFNFYKITIR